MNFLINTTLRKLWIYGVAVVVLSSGWQSAIAANWYVDNVVATSGNGQSWASAYKNFSNITWSAIKPGDTLYISGGSTSKTYTSPLTIEASGTASSRINVRVGQDTGHAGTVILDGANIQGGKNYITIDGSVNGVAKLWVKNITDSSKDNGWAFDVSGSTGFIIKYVTITNCNNGINFTYGNNYEVSNSSITGRGDTLIRGIYSGLNGWDANKIHDNYLEMWYALGDGPNGGSGGPDGIQVGHSTSIYNNSFQEVRNGNIAIGQHPDNLQLAGFNIKVYDNSFLNIGDSNIDYDVWASGAIQNLWIYNNLFRQTITMDPVPENIRIYSTGAAMNTVTGLKILNNTFVDQRPGIVAEGGQLIGISFNKGGTGSGSGNEIRNNLAYGTVDGISMKYGWGSQFVLAFSNNIYPQAQSEDPSESVGVPSLDANFAPIATDNLARDRGMTLSYFSTDKLGTLRPQGSAWDIGAFEYSSNNSSVILPATNLQIVK